MMRRALISLLLFAAWLLFATLIVPPLIVRAYSGTSLSSVQRADHLAAASTRSLNTCSTGGTSPGWGAFCASRSGGPALSHGRWPVGGSSSARSAPRRLVRWALFAHGHAAFFWP